MSSLIKMGSMALVAILAAAAILIPSQDRPLPNESEAPVAAPYTVCALGEAARRTTALAVVSDGASGTAGIKVFSSGDIEVDEEVELAESASTSFVLNDWTGLTRAPVLASLPDPAMAVETLLSGDGAAASSCDAGSPGSVVLPGGSTAEGETYSVVLANPFAGSATVSVGSSSEVGVESDPGLSAVIVPPRSVVVVDLSTLLPGRQTMSVSVTPLVGRVVASTVQEGGGDVSALSGLNPAGDWFLPVSSIEGARRSLVVATAGTSDVPFQLDLYDEQGRFEAAYEDTIPARGQVTVDIADLFEGVGAIRVVAAAPVAATLGFDGEGTRTVIPGVSGLGPSWLLPGAGRLGASSVLLFNPGEIEVQAEVVSGGGESALEAVTVPGSAMVAVPISGGHGARVEADGDLAVTWMTVTETGSAGDAARLSTQ